MGSTIPIGVGVALKSKMIQNKKKIIAAIFFGEGAGQRKGCFLKASTFAAVNNLPV